MTVVGEPKLLFCCFKRRDEETQPQRLTRPPPLRGRPAPGHLARPLGAEGLRSPPAVAPAPAPVAGGRTYQRAGPAPPQTPLPNGPRAHGGRPPPSRRPPRARRPFRLCRGAGLRAAAPGRAAAGPRSGSGSGSAMASCADILRSEFPDLDGEVFAYVTGERRPPPRGSASRPAACRDAAPLSRQPGRGGEGWGRASGRLPPPVGRGATRGRPSRQRRRRVPAGILHGSGADFESVDELVEAVGELLREVSRDAKDDGAIREICQRLFNTLQL